MRDARPDPDELLRAIGDEARSAKLKIFLGASAGVGKTYSMLGEAREQQRRGLAVRIGYVETHGRKETEALVEGLAQIPLKVIDYRGAQLQELDVEAIKTERPDLVLIDELAHTNAPGSLHAKRWQDVEDVLAAGIDVYTAVNIQHLESLNDVVAQVTGVRVAETVPDSFFERADEIEVVDIPPAELQQRLKEGKVYVPERVEQALEGFFKTSNLTALRELALRRAADSVDAEMRRLRTQQGVQETWSTRERVVVCVAPNRLANRVVRAAARLGAVSHAEVMAVYVESDRQTARSTEEHAEAQSALALARELGMEVVQLQGHDIVAEIIDFARRRNASLVVVGKPIRPRWKEVLFGSVVDELVRASGDIDVHVITGEPVAAPKPQNPVVTSATFTLGGSALVLGVTALATGVGFALFQGFGIANVAMVYVLAVAVCATRTSAWESAAAALLGVLSFNFFFVEPRFTFAVSDVRYVLVFAVMLMVAIVISTLTHRLRNQLQASSARERTTASLYALSRQLAQSRSKRDLAAAAAKEIRENFHGDVAVFLHSGTGLVNLEPSRTGFESDPSELAVANWVLERGVSAGIGTDTLPGSSALYLPLKGSDSTVGVLAFSPSGEFQAFTQRQLLETFANALGLALERAILAKASNDARVLAESERIRSTLLSSISHDLRTPLTSITGAASSLMEGASNRELAETIYQESIRLNQQIQNLLDMTRLQSGGVVLDRKWHAAGDLMSTALRHTQPVLGGRPVKFVVPADLPLLFVDGLLIEKALINLLENAGRHTGPQDAVELSARLQGTSLYLTVQDSGPGIAPSERDNLFQPGFKGEKGGHGLGLAIVKAIIDLHGGEVSVENDRGARFTLRLPLPDHQPEIPRG